MANVPRVASGKAQTNVGICDINMEHVREQEQSETGSQVEVSQETDRK